MKISFPDLRNELFVNILGYKEPNLIHLWRCKVFLYDDEYDFDDDGYIEDNMVWYFLVMVLCGI